MYKPSKTVEVGGCFPPQATATLSWPVMIPTIWNVPVQEQETEVVDETDYKERTKKQSTHIIFVVDESGSMLSLRDTIIEQFNEQISSFKEKIEDKKYTDFSWYSFGGSKIRKIFFRQSLIDAPPLERKTYSPRGNTPLLDAVGTALEDFSYSTNSLWNIRDRFVMVIFSDGQENSSVRYKKNGGETRLQEQIKRLQNNGNWTFVYIGSETDLTTTKFAQDLGIWQSNIYSMTYSGGSLPGSMNVVSQGLVAYANSAERSVKNLLGTQDSHI